MANCRSRRKPVATLVAIGLFLAVASLSVPAFAQVLLDPLTQPRFVNPLPVPPVIDATGGGTFTVDITQFQQDLGLVDPVTGLPLLTTVWGYNGTYPGPTFVVRKDVPIDVLWRNQLVDGAGQPLPHLLPVDTSLHWASPLNWPFSGVPVVTHVHGGHTESASDGLPDAWFTPGFAQTGHGFVKQTLHYDNDQEAATIWYHDHALGITRLNVYAGLAGYYLVRDANEDALIAAGNLPTGPYDLGLAIQDRMFTADGQLHYPSLPPTPTSPNPSVLPEFFGDFILVNGKAWPVLDVEPRQYRFRFLNGSDSRFYNLNLVEGPNATGSLPVNATLPAMWQIGSDTGLLNAPVLLKRLLLGTGERADVVIDFSDPAFFGRSFILRNNAKSPFPNGAAADPQTAGQIMMFRVSLPLDPNAPLTPLPANLRPLYGPIQPLAATPGVPPRQLILSEMMDQYGRMMPMLGTAAAGAMMWDDPLTENPMLGDTEIWEVYNTTPDAHPVHLHLVSFQILDRQKYRATVDPMTAALTNIKLVGKPQRPSPEESGWKDTAIAYPGERLRVIAHFDREGLYVWHCHILSHEDNEMMRPFYVGTAPHGGHMAARPGAGGDAGSATATEAGLTAENAPNPFNPMTQINFRLPAAATVSLKVFDMRGRLVRTLASGEFEAGSHSVVWDGRDASGVAAASGVYFYELRAGDQVARNRMVLMK